MNVASSYTATKVHPETLARVRAIVFTFDTGHTMTRYHGGVEFFTKANGRALNPVSGANLVAKMRAAVAA